MISDKIDRLREELAFYLAVYDDFVVGDVPAVNIRTDAVYADFCRRHPTINVGQRRFTRLLCEELGLKSEQGFLDGIRGCFYVRCQ